jgi:hypothetical protein
MKKLFFEMFLIITLSLCISLLYNMLSPSGLRILPKKKPAVVGLHMTDRAPVSAHALSGDGGLR